MAEGIAISADRQHAKSTYPADLQTVGLHLNGNVGVSLWLAKPATATHIKLQALTQNLRYRIDAGTAGAAPATAAIGFQLAAGADTLIPVPNTGISLAQEVAGATYQAQWVR
jgi:hypothetical protein